MNYTVKKVSGDGNCMIRSLLFGLLHVFGGYIFWGTVLVPIFREGGFAVAEDSSWVEINAWWIHFTGLDEAPTFCISDITNPDFFAQEDSIRSRIFLEAFKEAIVKSLLCSPTTYIKNYLGDSLDEVRKVVSNDYDDALQNLDGLGNYSSYLKRYYTFDEDYIKAMHPTESKHILYRVCNPTAALHPDYYGTELFAGAFVKAVREYCKVGIKLSRFVSANQIEPLFVDGDTFHGMVVANIIVEKNGWHYNAVEQAAKVNSASNSSMTVTDSSMIGSSIAVTVTGSSAAKVNGAPTSMTGSSADSAAPVRNIAVVQTVPSENLADLLKSVEVPCRAKAHKPPTTKKRPTCEDCKNLASDCGFCSSHCLELKHHGRCKFHNRFRNQVKRQTAAAQNPSERQAVLLCEPHKVKKVNKSYLEALRGCNGDKDKKAEVHKQKAADLRKLVQKAVKHEHFEETVKLTTSRTMVELHQTTSDSTSKVAGWEKVHSKRKRQVGNTKPKYDVARSNLRHVADDTRRLNRSAATRVVLAMKRNVKGVGGQHKEQNAKRQKSDERRPTPQDERKRKRKDSTGPGAEEKLPTSAAAVQPEDCHCDSEPDAKAPRTGRASVQKQASKMKNKQAPKKGAPKKKRATNLKKKQATKKIGVTILQGMYNTTTSFPLHMDDRDRHDTVFVVGGAEGSSKSIRVLDYGMMSRTKAKDWDIGGAVVKVCGMNCQETIELILQFIDDLRSFTNAPTRVVIYNGMFSKKEHEAHLVDFMSRVNQLPFVGTKTVTTFSNPEKELVDGALQYLNYCSLVYYRSKTPKLAEQVELVDLQMHRWPRSLACRELVTQCGFTCNEEEMLPPPMTQFVQENRPYRGVCGEILVKADGSDVLLKTEKGHQRVIEPDQVAKGVMEDLLQTLVDSEGTADDIVHDVLNGVASQVEDAEEEEDENCKDFALDDHVVELDDDESIKNYVKVLGCYRIRFFGQEPTTEFVCSPFAFAACVGVEDFQSKLPSLLNRVYAKVKFCSAYTAHKVEGLDEKELRKIGRNVLLWKNNVSLLLGKLFPDLDLNGPDVDISTTLLSDDSLSGFGGTKSKTEHCVPTTKDEDGNPCIDYARLEMRLEVFQALAELLSQCPEEELDLMEDLQDFKKLRSQVMKLFADEKDKRKKKDMTDEEKQEYEDKKKKQAEEREKKANAEKAKRVLQQLEKKKAKQLAKNAVAKRTKLKDQQKYTKDEELKLQHLLNDVVLTTAKKNKPHVFKTCKTFCSSWDRKLPELSASGFVDWILDCERLNFDAKPELKKKQPQQPPKPSLFLGEGQLAPLVSELIPAGNKFKLIENGAARSKVAYLRTLMKRLNDHVGDRWRKLLAVDSTTAPATTDPATAPVNGDRAVIAAGRGGDVKTFKSDDEFTGIELDQPAYCGRHAKIRKSLHTRSKNPRMLFVTQRIIQDYNAKRLCIQAINDEIIPYCSKNGKDIGWGSTSNLAEVDPALLRTILSGTFVVDSEQVEDSDLGKFINKLRKMKLVRDFRKEMEDHARRKNLLYHILECEVKSERNKLFKNKSRDWKLKTPVKLSRGKLPPHHCVQIPMEEWARKKKKKNARTNEISAENVLNGLKTLTKDDRQLPRSDAEGTRFGNTLQMLKDSVGHKDVSIQLVCKNSNISIHVSKMEKFACKQNPCYDSYIFDKVETLAKFHLLLLKHGWSIGSCDLGVRTFGVVYDAIGTYLTVADREATELENLLHEVDSLQAKIDRMREEDGTDAKKVERLLESKRDKTMHIKNKVRDNHRRFVHFIVHNYNYFVVAPISAKQMCCKRITKEDKVTYLQRGIRSPTARLIYTWSYREFIEMLKREAKKFGNKVTLILPREPYTTQECGKCEHRYKPNGETYQCPNKACGYRTLRDVNGARNILIRVLSISLPEDLVLRTLRKRIQNFQWQPP